MKNVKVIFSVLMFIVIMLSFSPLRNVATVVNESPESDFQWGENNEIVKYLGTSSEVVIPSRCTSIGKQAFMEIETLKNVTIPNGVTSIGTLAFSATSLEKIIIPGSVKTIGVEAFSYTPLKSVELSEGVVTIESEAFRNCEVLESVIIPNSMTSIGSSAFQECYSLKTINIPDSVASIEDNVLAFSGFKKVIIVRNKLVYVPSTFSSFTIPDKVTHIVSGAFRGSLIKNLTLSNKITKIDANAFAGSALASIAIPDYMTSIEPFAFNGCASLVSVVIPKSVTRIGDFAFQSCDKISIYGFNGSFAQKYAKNSNLPFTEITTKIPAAKPLAPKNLKAIKAKINTSLSWSAVSGADSYIIYYKIEGTNEYRTKTSKINKITIGNSSGNLMDHLTLLDPKNNYSFYVSAVNIKGESTASMSVSTKSK